MMAEGTAAAPLDALLIAQAIWRDDEESTRLLMRDCDPWAVIRQLSAWLRCTVQTALDQGAGPEFGDSDEFDVIQRWIQDALQEVSNR